MTTVGANRPEVIYTINVLTDAGHSKPAFNRLCQGKSIPDGYLLALGKIYGTYITLRHFELDIPILALRAMYLSPPQPTL